MTTIQHAYKQLLFSLYDLYDNREAANIANWVIEYVTNQTKIDRIVYPNIPLNEEQITNLEQITNQLLAQIPVQHILGEAWFGGMKFFVNNHVLIPRPETDELVELIVQEYKAKNNLLNIIDIGTGSGCIGISIQKKLINSKVIAVDISKEALLVAQQNATNLGAAVLFKEIDFLDESNWNLLEKFHVIVSNPPYIHEFEKEEMHERVTNNEPHIALFVSNENPLIFYDAIARFGKTHLETNGKIFVEINEQLGKETATLFEKYGYKVSLKKDLQEKDRMIVAWIEQ